MAYTTNTRQPQQIHFGKTEKIMNENPAGKLFKEPTLWPRIPPWWLITSADAATLLNIKPATLSSWRIRGHGPTPFPPMYLRATQGRPTYYQYGTVRSWAASRLGMTYSFKDQCLDFFRETLRSLAEGTGHMDSRIETFERALLKDRENAMLRKQTMSFPPDTIHYLDIYQSRQPRRMGPKYIEQEFEVLERAE